MKKYLEVKFQDGTTWRVPTPIISSHRASYYAKKDSGTNSGDEFEKVFIREFRYAENNMDEVIDWAFNSMNWSDIAPHAQQVSSVKSLNYDEEWTNAEHEIVSYSRY